MWCIKMDNQRQHLLIVAATIISATTIKLKSRERRRKRSIWVKPWLERRWSGRGILTMLNDELRNEEPDLYKNYLRMTSEQFAQLLEIIAPDIVKQDTFMRDSISAQSKYVLPVLL